jgi:ADP-heptose:LPS heptosyltransferase
MAHISPSVLLIRLDAVGDALALAPLLAALRERGIPVDLVVTERNRDALASAAARRRYVAPFALRDGSKINRAVISAFGSELQANEYTHVLLATEDPGAYRLARATRAKHRIGFENGWGKPLKTLWIRSLLTKTIVRTAGLDENAPHECEVLFALGASLLEPGAVPTHDLAQLRPMVLDREPAPDARVAFQVTDKWERLGIAFDDVVACARAIPNARFIASSNERGYGDRFSGAADAKIDYFDSLAPWKEAIAAARALVAPDSGALHVAGMTGTPTVAIFPPQPNLALQTARWHPWAAPYRAVEAQLGWQIKVARALNDVSAT